MTNPSSDLNLQTLAKRIDPASHQLRDDGRDLVLIAGAIGHVNRDLYLHCLPEVGVETKLFRAMLGLFHRLSKEAR